MSGSHCANGSAQIGNVEVDIDASASDVIDQLEMGGMAAYRVENGTWSFTTDATYFALGANQTSGSAVTAPVVYTKSVTAGAAAADDHR